VPLIVGGLFLSEGVINLIGGTGFEESANVLRILIFALTFIFFGHFFNNILLSGNLQKKLMIVLGICAAFNISLNFILIPTLSYTGAAITSVLTEVLVVVLTFYLTVKYLKYRPRIDNWGKIIFSGIVMAVFLFVFNDTNFFLLAFGSVSIYFLFLWLTKTITSNELLSIVAKREA